MTAALLDRAAVRLPDSRQNRRQNGPKLRVLDQAATRRRARHRSALLILFIAVLAGFFAVAFVHAELVAGQHELDAVRAEISQAEARHAELARTVEEASAPDVIVTRATELGMVRAVQPVYLTAAAPLRTIEAGPSLQSPAATGNDVDGSIAQVAAGDGTAEDGVLQGSIGRPGGISAAVRIEATPSVAMGPSESPAPTADTTDQPAEAASTVAQTTAATSAPAESVNAADSNDPAPATPTSSIAGTRAVSSAAGATASTISTQPIAPAVADGAGSPASGPAGTTAGTSASSTDTGSSGTNPAGGLASAAATTSG